MYRNKPSPFVSAVEAVMKTHQITRVEAESLVVEEEKKRFTHKEQREYEKRVKQYSRPGKPRSESEKSAVKNIMNSRPLREYARKMTSTKYRYTT